MKSKQFRCLSVRQPWAWAICVGAKVVENRTWKTDYRGQIAIHASASKQAINFALKQKQSARLRPDWFTTGAIIGVADVADVVALNETLDSNPWAMGPCCWLLSNPRLIASPIPCKGKLTLYSLPDDISEQLGSQLEKPEPVQHQREVAAYLEAIRPADLDVCFDRAVNYCSFGDLQGAIRNCTTIITHEPRNSDAHRVRAACYTESGDHKRALVDCERALQLAPEDAFAYLARAIIHKNLGDTAKSERDYLRAKELDPTIPALDD